MEQVFLEAKMPLTKTFTLQNNVLEKSQYPLAKQFKSHRVAISSVQDMFKAVEAHAKLGHCMLKGRLHRDLNWESRANSTIPDDVSDTIVFDLDNVSGFANVDTFMDNIGLGDVSYVVQYSASYQVDPKKTGLSAHIIVMLASPISATLIKNYLANLNFTNSTLAPQVNLTSSDVSLSFPLDVTVGQNDKLIYIAPPECVGFFDPMVTRIHLVKKNTDVFIFPADIPNAEQVEKARRQRINELRAQKGLASRRIWKLKDDGVGAAFVPNPTAATVTGLKSERGYTYLNLNGGDSWAYYHPDDDPTTIFSFKGDGPFKTKEIAPEYWAEVSKTLETKAVGGVIHMAYRHFSTAQYYNVIYDQADHTLKIAKAGSLIQLQHFMEQYNKPWSGTPTDWDHIYDPTPVPYDTFNRINVDNRTINLYTPPEYTKTYDPNKQYQLPEVLWRLLLHVCGGHEPFTLNLINSLAFQIQTGFPASTCTVLHGTTGTGKGIFINEVLPRIFGSTNVTIQKANVLNDQFNSYMENSQIVVFEEVNSELIRNVAATDSTLKNAITERKITVRSMYREPREIDKRCSFFMTSNSASPVHIHREDRRMNCGEYQAEKFTPTEKDIDLIKYSCEEFYGYLRQFKYDADATRKIIDTEARKQIVATTALGIEEFYDEVVKKGNFMYLLDQLPMSIPMDVQQSQLPLKEYATIVAMLLERVTSREQKIAVFRDELRILLSYNFPRIPIEPAKFSAMVKHHRMYMDTVRRGPQTGKGMYITFRFSEEDLITANNIFATTLRAFANAD